jgi:hypothetical protein
MTGLNCQADRHRKGLLAKEARCREVRSFAEALCHSACIKGLAYRPGQNRLRSPLRDQYTERLLMKTLGNINVAAIGFVLCLGAAASADVLVWSHTGTNNPVTEGWTQYTGGAGFTGIDGANDGSWEIGTTTAQYRTYDHTNDLTAAQLSLAETNGYKLEMVVKAQTGILPQPVRHEIGGQALIGGTLHVWSAIGFGSDASGNVLVGLIDGPGYNYGTTATVPGSGSAYHTYDLIFKPSNGKEDLYVDGSLLIANHTPASYPNTWGLENSYINFGANDGTATGTGWYKSVEFSVISPVPEPSTLAMLPVALVGLLAYARRSRK